MRRAVVFALFLAFAGFAAAQDSIRWKQWNSSPGLQQPPRTFFEQHLLVEFAAPPAAADIDQLRDRGAKIVGALSERAVVVSAPAAFAAPQNVTWIGQLAPANKISPLLHTSSRIKRRDAGPDPVFIVEFYADVDMGDARSLVIGSGFEIIENPDLVPNHLLVQGSLDNLTSLAASDEVEYVFPASADLVEGVPVNSCAGALTAQGAVSQGVPAVGEGWDGPGKGAAVLNYAFASLTPNIPADTAASEIVRAFSEWSRYAKVTFTAANAPAASRTLTVLFASGAHGDAYPFQNRGTIAHTFYPYPLNPEPIAGDLHFNNDENWHVGLDIDLFSVALHETGHALGLGHSDNPGDVMYPYYRRVTGLANGDIQAIQELYAAQDAVTPDQPPAAPLAVVVDRAPSSVSAASVTLTGTVTGGAGGVQVSWTNGALSGVMQGSRNWSGSVPLDYGANAIAISAVDAQKNASGVTLAITRQPSPPSTSIEILQPASADSYSVGASTITIAGTASDSMGIDRVSWTNSRGGSGQAVGTTSWSAGPISLVTGQNVITLTAFGKTAGVASKSITVTYTPAPSPPKTTPGNDTTPPTLTILSPSSTNVFTSAATMVFSGAASDNVGVNVVTWTNSNGGAGGAAGTANWTTGPIPLLVGSNSITIRAADAAGNVAWRSVMVTRGR